MLKTVVLVGIIAYALICAVLYIKQRALLYFPTPSTVAEGAEAIYLTVDNHRLKIWQLNPGQTKAILYFGGNAEDVAQNTGFYRDQFPEHTVYLVNYRGYGGSEGKPTEAALLGDALAIFDWASQSHNDIVVVGRSLGSGVAMHVTAERSVNRQVLITPYDSVLAVAKARFFWLPVSWLLLDRFDSLSRAPKVDVATLVLAADHDLVIPSRHTKTLVSALNSDLTDYFELDNTDHNSIDAHPGYAERLRAFIQR